MAKISREQQRDMELVGTAPQPPTFVPARREAPKMPDIIMPGPSVGPAWETALTPSKDDSRDSLSAADRAKGRLIDSIPAHAGLLTLSAFGALLFWRVGDASSIDSFLAFLFFSSVAIIYYNLDDLRQRLAHSRAGIERHKIDTVGELYRAQLEHEAEVRRDALSLQLKLLEVKHDDD